MRNCENKISIISQWMKVVKWNKEIRNRAISGLLEEEIIISRERKWLFIYFKN